MKIVMLKNAFLPDDPDSVTKISARTILKRNSIQEVKESQGNELIKKKCAAELKPEKEEKKVEKKEEDVKPEVKPSKK